MSDVKVWFLIDPVGGLIGAAAAGRMRRGSRRRGRRTEGARWGGGRRKRRCTMLPARLTATATSNHDCNNQSRSSVQHLGSRFLLGPRHRWQEVDRLVIGIILRQQSPLLLLPSKRQCLAGELLSLVVIREGGKDDINTSYLHKARYDDIVYFKRNEYKLIFSMSIN